MTPREKLCPRRVPRSLSAPPAAILWGGARAARRREKAAEGGRCGRVPPRPLSSSAALRRGVPSCPCGHTQPGASPAPTDSWAQCHGVCQSQHAEPLCSHDGATGGKWRWWTWRWWTWSLMTTAVCVLVIGGHMGQGRRWYFFAQSRRLCPKTVRCAFTPRAAGHSKAGLSRPRKRLRGDSLP